MKTKVLIAALVAAAMAFGCKKNDEDTPAAPEPVPAATKTIEMPPEPSPKTTQEPSQMPAFAAVITFEVADFDKWKTTFDSHMALRKAAGVLGHHISRGVEDAKQVTVYFALSDLEKFKEFIASDDLKKAMAEAGVESQSAAMIMKPVEDHAIMDRAVVGMIVTHEVEDFDKWKTAYDEFADARAKAGIIGDAVNRDVENENLVIVLHQAETPEQLNAFLAMPELKDAMKNGGVKGEPKIMMVTSMPAAMY